MNRTSTYYDLNHHIIHALIAFVNKQESPLMAIGTVLVFSFSLSLAACATLSWHGVYQGRTLDGGQGPNASVTEACSAVCAQLNPNGRCGRWVEPVGEACRTHLKR